MITPVIIDIESRSRADLKVVGGRRYWEHPSTEALVVVWYDTADDSVDAWYPPAPWPHHGRVLAAHSAFGFDRFGAERLGFEAAGWIDTMYLARRAGLAGSLDALARAWCDAEKDAVSSRFTKALSRVRRPADVTPDQWRGMADQAKRDLGVLPVVDHATLDRVTVYCASDVAILAQAWPRLREWLDVDVAAADVDRAINDRGIAFDETLARTLLCADAQLRESAVRTAAAALGVDEEEARAAAASPAQFCAIVNTPDARASTIESCTHPLAVARRATATIARGKLIAGLARVHADGRLRDAHLYYGAHTGRWSSRGVQLHNLPRQTKRFEGVDIDTFADEVLAGRPCDAEEIEALVRATLCAPPGRALIACDYSSIEARVRTWLARDEPALGVFRRGEDPYLVAASAIFGRAITKADKAERQVGKVAELACGYGGGPRAFESFARDYRVDVSDLNLRRIVDTWRERNPAVVALWRDCETAWRDACEDRVGYAGACRFVRSDDGDAVACMLPSGRPIVYQNASVSGRSLSYRGSRGPTKVYGGKLTENAVQGIARDLMSDALVRSERDGLYPVLSVHDEIVCEVDAQNATDALAHLRAIMVDAPAWADELPIDVSGWTGRRYRK